jgi:hypothetical protein
MDAPMNIADMTRGPYQVHYRTQFLFRRHNGRWQRKALAGRDQAWKTLTIDQDLLTAQKANMQFDSTAAWKWI